MAMLEVHASALGSGSVCYHDFLLRYKAMAQEVYGLVEGKEDPVFYQGLIESSLPDGWSVALIPAGRRSSVVDAYAAFDWSAYSTKRICFFLDRDLTDFFEEEEISHAENVYVTDQYSIENDLVDIGVLKRILTEILNVSSLTSDEIAVIEQRFQSALTLFRATLLPIMAQVVIWRRSGKRPSLDNVRPKELFLFVDGSMSLRPEYNNRDAHVAYAAGCVGLEVSPSDELQQVLDEIKHRMAQERVIRGKYLLWFLVELALQIHRSVPTLLPNRKEVPRMRVSLGPGNAMVVVAPRARCPQSLRDFIHRTYGQYIANIHVATVKAIGTSATS